MPSGIQYRPLYSRNFTQILYTVDVLMCIPFMWLGGDRISMTSMCEPVVSVSPFFSHSIILPSCMITFWKWAGSGCHMVVVLAAVAPVATVVFDATVAAQSKLCTFFSDANSLRLSLVGGVITVFRNGIAWIWWLLDGSANRNEMLPSINSFVWSNKNVARRELHRTYIERKDNKANIDERHIFYKSRTSVHFCFRFIEYESTRTMKNVRMFVVFPDQLNNSNLI